MKKYYLFLFLLLICFKFQSQTNCSQANSEINYAYSNVKHSYEANNISHLKEYAFKSLEAFKRAETKLKECGCEVSYNHAYDAMQLLEKVEPAESYEDGRFFVKRARDLAKECIIELDKCTAENQDDNSLSLLQDAQKELQQQQLLLKQKETEIKLKLAEQKEKELLLKKEEMINQYNSAISSNVTSFNAILKMYNSKDEVVIPNENSGDLMDKSLEEIKSHYLQNLKGLTNSYLSFLNSCVN
jgi:hypothetical protein